MGRLEGKVAFVTGAAGGIGRAICERFVQEGGRVAASDVNSTAVSEWVANANGHAISIHCDVGDPDSVKKAVGEATKAFGKLNVLCNVAGGSGRSDGTILNAPEEEFWNTIRLNLFGTFLCCKYGIPEIIKAGGGSVINFASIAAIMTLPNRICYTAAKGGVVAMSKTMAAEHGRDGVRVNAIAPGRTLSPRVKEMKGATAETDRIGSRHLVGLLDPLDIAHLAVFLASDESRRITGQLYTADSGASVA